MTARTTSLSARFLLGVAVMLLPLVNIAATALFALHQVGAITERVVVLQDLGDELDDVADALHALVAAAGTRERAALPDEALAGPRADLLRLTGALEGEAAGSGTGEQVALLRATDRQLQGPVPPARAADAAAAIDGAVESVRAQQDRAVADMEASRREARSVVAVVCLAGVAVAAVAGRRLARHVLRPLTELRRGAEAIASGELDHRIRSRRQDEIAAVAHAFDAMAESVQDGARELGHQATHDSLTDLLNRRALAEEMRRLVVGGDASAVVLDVDGFKEINDTLGHAAGDAVVVDVARRLGAAALPGWVVARTGGDEFVVVLHGLRDRDALCAEADRLRHVLAQPMGVGGHRLALGVSAGTAALAPGGTAEELLRDADLALYAAKRAGGGRTVPFTADLLRDAQARPALLADLARGLAAGELEAWFQPVVDPRDGTVLGAEALARWRHPDRGLLAPGLFVPLAEESDHVLDLGEQMLRAAVAEAAVWEREHPGRGLRCSVNLSARQLEGPGLPAVVRDALRSVGLPPARLVLELTESAVMADPEASRARLQAVRDLGVGLAVDDFGTGHSSLAYLTRLPLDELKIDKSFVDGVGEDDASADSVLVGGVLALARALRLRTVGEGVERPEQAAALARMGCHAVQGYHYAPPVPREHFCELLARGPLGALPVALPAPRRGPPAGVPASEAASAVGAV